EGSGAGSDNVLNFYSRSSCSERSVSPNTERRCIRRIQGPSLHATTKCVRNKFFSRHVMDPLIVRHHYRRLECAFWTAAVLPSLSPGAPCAKLRRSFRRQLNP